MSIRFLAALVVCLGFSAASNAALITTPPPNSAIYDAGNGLEWVYASPCAGGCETPELNHGFRYATDEEFNSSFAAGVSDVIAAFMVPNINSWRGAGCASAHFSNRYSHCDGRDLHLGRFVYSGPNGTNYETLLVRGRASGPQVGVPEPSVIALFALGLAGLTLSRRRKTA